MNGDRDGQDDSRLTEKEAAQRALDLSRQGARGKEQAALLLYRRLARFIQRALVHGQNGSVNVPPVRDAADAEELVSNVIRKFLTGEPDGRASGLTWLYTAIKFVALDFHRQRLAQSRGEGLEVTRDAEQWEAIEQSGAAPVFGGAPPPNPGLADCIRRCMAELRSREPKTWRVLQLVFGEWDTREIAVFFGADPARVTEKELSAATSRKYEACKKARPYFAGCKE